MKISKPWRICIAVTLILIILIIVTLVVVYFTLLKPKQPKITTNQATLKHINFAVLPLHLDVTIGLFLTIENPNRASFAYENTTAFIAYRGTPAAQAPIGSDVIPARGDRNITADVTMNVDSLVSNDNFLADLDAGCFNFTSETMLRGEAKVLNLFKVKGTTHSTCQVSVYIFFQNATSVCTSKFKVK